MLFGANAKTLRRLLKGSDAEGAVGTLLAARDAYVTAQSARAAAPGEVRFARDEGHAVIKHCVIDRQS